MPEGSGNTAQARIVAEQVSEAAATLAVQKYAARPNPEPPAPVKWAGGIIAALMTAGVIGMAVWLVATVNTMQVTLARMEERQNMSSDAQGGRFDEINRRLSRLEALVVRDEQ